MPRMTKNVDRCNFGVMKWKGNENLESNHVFKLQFHFEFSYRWDSLIAKLFLFWMLFSAYIVKVHCL